MDFLMMVVFLQVLQYEILHHIHHLSTLDNCHGLHIFQVYVNLINQNQTLIDVIYIPLETKFLQYGKDVGALTLNGFSANKESDRPMTRSNSCPDKLSF